MGCFAGVLANKGPVKTEKTGGAAGKTGVQAIIPGGLAANPGGLAAATGVGAALTPVGAAVSVSKSSGSVLWGSLLIGIYFLRARSY
jgi:hypothetical protein